MNSKLKPKTRFKGFTDDWEQRKLGEIFKYSRPDNHIVSNTEYLDYGKTPVLTANKAFVLGYTNESKTFDNNSIIFDDFTLESKYVDFPYMVKSSAIKILEVRDNIKDDLYFNYNLLNSTKIEILGHARHYISIVQPTIVRTTFIDEQKSIATLFASIDNLITLHQRKCDKLVELKKSLLEKMFPQNNSVIPEIRFKGFTDDWEQRKLGEVIISIPLKDKIVFPYSFGKVEVIQQGQVPIAGYSDIPGFENYKDVVLFGDHTLSLYKPVRPFLVASDGVKAFRCDYMNGDYLYRIFEKNLPNNEGYKRYSSILKEQKIKCTINKNEQTKIGDLFRNIDNLITLHQSKHDKLNKIKQSLLNDMFV